MIANLYLCSKTFIHNGSDTDNKVYKKIINLHDLLRFVRNKYKNENIFYINKEELLSTQLFTDGSTVDDVFVHNKIINRDVFYLFMALWKWCSIDNSSLNELVERLSIEDEENCNGLVVFNLIDDLPVSYQIISDINGWYRFRRYYLGKYPNNTSYFLTECEKYFNNLVFHPDNNRSIKEVLISHSKKIIICLSALNDNLVEDLKVSNKSYTDYLREFAINYKLDGASMEGKKDKKFIYNFTGDNGENFSAYCESHLKMFKNDRDEDGHCRVYFRKPDVENEDSLIYIGYIGTHL